MENRSSLHKSGSASYLLDKIGKQLEELDVMGRKEDALATVLIQVDQVETQAVEALKKLHRDREEERDRKDKKQAKIREEHKRMTAEKKRLMEENAKLRDEIAGNEAKCKELLGVLHGKLPKYKDMF